MRHPALVGLVSILLIACGCRSDEPSAEADTRAGASSTASGSTEDVAALPSPTIEELSPQASPSVGPADDAEPLTDDFGPGGVAPLPSPAALPQSDEFEEPGQDLAERDPAGGAERDDLDRRVPPDLGAPVRPPTSSTRRPPEYEPQPDPNAGVEEEPPTDEVADIQVIAPPDDGGFDLGAGDDLDVVTVPSGTGLAVSFDETLSSRTSAAGDRFSATVTDGVLVDGRTAIPAGSRVRGVVTEAVPLRRVGGQARLVVEFEEIELPSGRAVPLNASFRELGRSETRRDAATIGGAAAAGAILGRILHEDDRTRGAVVGAVAGAAIGTAIASRTPGEEVELARGSRAELEIDRSLNVPVRPR